MSQHLVKPSHIKVSNLPKFNKRSKDFSTFHLLLASSSSILSTKYFGQLLAIYQLLAFYHLLASTFSGTYLSEQLRSTREPEGQFPQSHFRPWIKIKTSDFHRWTQSQLGTASTSMHLWWRRTRKKVKKSTTSQGVIVKTDRKVYLQTGRATSLAVKEKKSSGC